MHSEISLYRTYIYFGQYLISVFYNFFLKMDSVGKKMRCRTTAGDKSKLR